MLELPYTYANAKQLSNDTPRTHSSVDEPEAWVACYGSSNDRLSSHHDDYMSYMTAVCLLSNRLCSTHTDWGGRRSWIHGTALPLTSTSTRQLSVKTIAPNLSSPAPLLLSRATQGISSFYSETGTSSLILRAKIVRGSHECGVDIVALYEKLCGGPIDLDVLAVLYEYEYEI